MIDWSRVDELRSEVGEEDFREVAEMFLEEADEVVEALGNGPDESTLESQFHSLKGSALNLGFKTLASTCALQEQRAAAGEFDQIELQSAVDAYLISKDAFIQRL